MRAEYWIILLQGLKVTVYLTLASMAIALVLGLLLALGQLRRHRWFIYWPCRVWVELIRGTPLLLQIFFVFFVLPQAGVSLRPFEAGLAALGINYGAYLSEVYRAGIEAVPKGQSEAGYVLGLSERRILALLVLPQAIRIVIPPLGNYFLALFKDTALVSTISIVELLFATNLIASETFNYAELYGVAALYYLAVSVPASLGVRYTERRIGSNRPVIPLRRRVSI